MFSILLVDFNVILTNLVSRSQTLRTGAYQLEIISAAPRESGVVHSI